LPVRLECAQILQGSQRSWCHGRLIARQSRALERRLEVGPTDGALPCPLRTTPAHSQKMGSKALVHCTGRGVDSQYGSVSASALSSTIEDARTDCFRQCMVRRVTARASLVEKTSLRQCIRPLVESCAPGQDEFRCVSVLTSRTVVEDHYRKQVSETPF
jgi:hypothetical protein